MSEISITPMLGICAFSGTGKTTLLVNLLPRLQDRGLRVAVVKHAHHSFDIDHEGKDTYQIRKAGASQVLISSKERWALMVEEASEDHDNLARLIEHLDHSALDLILVEGFKMAAIPKLELHRPSLGKPQLHLQDDGIIAVATDEPEQIQTTLPILGLNDYEAICDFIQQHFFQPDMTKTG